MQSWMHNHEDQDTNDQGSRIMYRTQHLSSSILQHHNPMSSSEEDESLHDDPMCSIDNHSSSDESNCYAESEKLLTQQCCKAIFEWMSTACTCHENCMRASSNILQSIEASLCYRELGWLHYSSVTFAPIEHICLYSKDLRVSAANCILNCNAVNKALF